MSEQVKLQFLRRQRVSFIPTLQKFQSVPTTFFVKREIFSSTNRQQLFVETAAKRRAELQT